MTFLRTLTPLAACCLLLACQTPSPEPTPPEPTRLEKQEQTLLNLGFDAIEGADGEWELQMAGKLLFAFDSADLSDQARTSVRDMAHALMQVGIGRLRVEGHTDSRGSDIYNLRLSRQRAQAVADALVEAGMAREHIEVRGMGRSMLLDSEKAGENRRVAIVVPLE